MLMMENCSSFIDNLRIFVICLLIINNCNGLSHCSQDPCVSNTLTLSNGSRSENCPDVQYSNCDAFISSGWYRTDIPMLNHCPTSGLGLSCGTTFPAWMNGTNPTVDDGIVDREVCLKGPTSCCVKTYAIQVKNCSNFMAYCLHPLGSCPEKYCFGTFGTCLSTTTTTITTPTTTTIIASSTTKWEPAEIIPGLKTQRNASDDEGYNKDLKDSHVGYVVIGVVCSLLVIVLVAGIILVWGCRRHIPTKQKFTFPLSTNERTPSTTHICVSGVEDSKIGVRFRPLYTTFLRRLMFPVSTNERTPSTTHICVSEVEENKIIPTADFGNSNNKTARYHHPMETKNSNMVVPPSG